ncbi:hypothetical protein ACF0H5_020766 [Mactra antiquata]
MLVSGEQEDAIRQLFKDKNWPCWLKVLSDENVASLIQAGYTDIFPVTGEDYGMSETVYTEIKSEVVDIENNDDDDGDDDGHNDDVDVVGSADDVKERLVPEDGNDDTMDYDMVSDKKRTVRRKEKVKKEVEEVEEEEEEEINTTPRGRRRQARSTKQNNKKLKCALCDTYCVTLTMLKRHCRRRHKGMWLEFECRDCSEKFKTREDMWAHRREANHEPRRAIASSASRESHTPEELIAMGHLKCEICLNLYPHKRSLRRHMYKVHRDVLPKWTCAVCGSEYDSRAALWRHKRQSQHKTSLWTLGNYQCDSCGKIYNRYDSFREHKLSCKTEGESAEQKDYPCDICGLVFKSMLRVKSHKRGVHVVSPVVCHVCGAMCKNKRALLVHRRRHDMKNKKFACDDCGKTFFNNTLLTQHIRTHTKEKPYKCPLCNYRCAIKQNIHKHSQKVHKQPAKAVDLSGIKEPNTEENKQGETGNSALDLTDEPRNPAPQNTVAVSEPQMKSYDPAYLPDFQRFSEYQKYNQGRRELFGVDKMLGKDERELQALQSLGALSEGVHDLRAPVIDMDTRRPTEMENLHVSASSVSHDMSKDKYQSPHYPSSYMSELQDLRLPSAVRSNDMTADPNRKSYMPPNMGNYPGLSDMAFSPRGSGADTNPYKYNWGVPTSK